MVYPGRVSNVFVGLGIIFFVTFLYVGVGLAESQMDHSTSGALYFWLLAVGSLLFGEWMVYDAIRRRPLLVVDRHGLKSRTSQVPWSDVGEIRVVESELIVQHRVSRAPYPAGQLRRPGVKSEFITLNTMQIPRSDKALEDIAARIESYRPDRYRRQASPLGITQPTQPSRILIVIDRFRIVRHGALFIIAAVVMVFFGIMIAWVVYRDYHESIGTIVLALVSLYWLSAGLAAVIAGCAC